MERLTDSQREKLAQFRALTDGADEDVAISVLESADWNVETAAEFIFGAGSSSSAPPTLVAAPEFPPPTRRIPQFEVDDSMQGGPPPHAGPPVVWSAALRPLFSLLTFPFHIITNVLRFVFVNILHLPIPSILPLRFSSLNFYRLIGGGGGGSGNEGTGRGSADKWIRSLEEETGAMCIGSAGAAAGSGTGVDVGPSNLTSRRGMGAGSSQDEEPRKLLPNFVGGTYESVLQTCKSEARIGCIILVSDEHDDVAEFKRSTLTDPTLVQMLYNNQVVCWGGDVRDREAWSAAQKLQATTYPCIAFIALQPRRALASSSLTSPPSLTVLSRHQGPSTPASSGPTAAASLVKHLERSLLPRVKPFLDGIRSREREVRMERHYREEQDRAFASSAARDAERIQAKMRAEREAKEAERLRKEEEERAAEKKAEEERERKREEDVRMEWRKWARRAIVSKEGDYSGKGGVRVAFRLPGDRRALRTFSPEANLTSLFAFVDSNLISDHFDPQDDPSQSPGGGDLESQLDHNPAWWGFKVFSAYPRKEVGWEKGKRLGDVEVLRGGGQFVVEMIDNGVNLSKVERDDEDEDDGYDTEESE